VARDVPPLGEPEEPYDGAGGPGEPGDPGQGPGRPPGHVGSTGPGTVIGFALAGLVLGWLLRPVSIRLTETAPLVGWAPGLALFLAAAILGAVAWSTYRSLHPRRLDRARGFHPDPGLEPHKAVNRLVLAKASAIVGALVGGGYLGYALSWWGVSEAALAQQRLVQSLVAGLGGALVVTASLLLERACRVGPGGGADLP
jgi:hypothetical protein